MQVLDQIVKCLYIYLIGQGALKEGKTMKLDNKVCNCNQYCLDSICISSDSNLRVRKCWCADCKVVRKETKANAYKITVVEAK